jgi:hypothetical protein
MSTRLPISGRYGCRRRLCDVALTNSVADGVRLTGNGARTQNDADAFHQVFNRQNITCFKKGVKKVLTE